MTVEQLADLVSRRFRQALTGYVILAIFAIAGLVVSYVQEQHIRANAARAHRNTVKLEQIAVCDAPEALRRQYAVDVVNCAQLIADYAHVKPGGRP